MEQTIGDRILKKAILFSCLTAVSTVIWIEVIGMKWMLILVFIITGFMFRRWAYGKRKQY